MAQLKPWLVGEDGAGVGRCPIATPSTPGFSSAHKQENILLFKGIFKEEKWGTEL